MPVTNLTLPFKLTDLGSTQQELASLYAKIQRHREEAEILLGKDAEVVRLLVDLEWSYMGASGVMDELARCPEMGGGDQT